jgi:hypothetical protein
LKYTYPFALEAKTGTACKTAAPAPSAGTMIARTRSQTVVFSKPFLLKSIGRMLPAGDYRVVTDEELIEELSFPVYRRVSTMIFVPAESHQSSAVEMVAVDPQELQAAQDRDAEVQQASP